MAVRSHDMAKMTRPGLLLLAAVRYGKNDCHINKTHSLLCLHLLFCSSKAVCTFLSKNPYAIHFVSFWGYLEFSTLCSPLTLKISTQIEKIRANAAIVHNKTTQNGPTMELRIKGSSTMVRCPIYQQRNWQLRSVTWVPCKTEQQAHSPVDWPDVLEK